MLLQLPDAPASAGASALPTAQPSARQNKRQRSMPTGEPDAVRFIYISTEGIIRCDRQTANAGNYTRMHLARCSWTLWRY